MAFLNWEDYVICVVTLVFSLGVGLFYSLRRSEKQKTTHEFIMGDGKMAVIPVAVSLMVTLISGITMFGVPAEVYMYGMQMFIGTTAIFFSNLLNMHLLLPAQKKLRITSVNQVTG
ncbi:Sodium-dependent multivitamin transporter [Mizuhopecten yessoensis]|uniref:Sodium-dependent multivitamin transporter n=1 Tax=Mizuhopecten yessoensis TaxID=6573 RepID=A0A210QUC3_MIZYE|nr:Sodium-dependent multivitamin transporter [Mizuhopecten yessoensis]